MEVFKHTVCKLARILDDIENTLLDAQTFLVACVLSLVWVGFAAGGVNNFVYAANQLTVLFQSRSRGSSSRHRCFCVVKLTLQIFRGASVTKAMGHKAQMHWWRLWVVAVTWRTACFALSVVVDMANAPTIARSDVCCSKDLSFEECQLIPCYAWGHVNSGTWPSLRRCLGVPEHVQVLPTKPKTSVNTQGLNMRFLGVHGNSNPPLHFRFVAYSPKPSVTVTAQEAESRAILFCRQQTLLQHVYDFFVYIFFDSGSMLAVPLPGGKLQEAAWTSKQLLSAIMPGRFASKRNEAPEVLRALSPCYDLEDSLSVCLSMLDSVLHKNAPAGGYPLSLFMLNTEGLELEPVPSDSCVCLARALRNPTMDETEKGKLRIAPGALKAWGPVQPLRDSVSEGHGVMLCALRFADLGWKFTAKVLRWTQQRRGRLCWAVGGLEPLPWPGGQLYFPHQSDSCTDVLRMKREDLNLNSCWEIPAVAWEKLRLAQWTKLKRAHFAEHLGEKTF